VALRLRRCAIGEDYSCAADGAGGSAASDRDDLARLARGCGWLALDACRASRSVVAHQFKKGSRTTIVGPAPLLTKHSGGISFRDRLFWTVPQQIAPPVLSSIEGPAKIGGSAARSSSTMGSVDIITP